MNICRIIFLNVVLFATILPLISKNTDLVDINKIDSTIVADIKYATKHNFTGQIIYPTSICYLHKDAAQALCNVQKELRSLNLGLKIWDGYRSPAVQQKLWDVCAKQYPDEKAREQYVSNPKKGGRHTRGTAVDVTLVDAHGNELIMPTGFDDFSTKAWADDASCCIEAQKNRKLLRDLMSKHGFDGIKTEWWHFDLKGWQNYQPIRN